MHFTRPLVFLLSLSVALVLPSAIPHVGIDYSYFFIMILVLAAWFSIKWTSIKKLPLKSNLWEIIAGCALVTADYLENFALGSSVGLVDMIVIFSAIITAFYGIRAFRLFWVPLTYGLVLLAGYQLENVIPNFVALQDWMAGLMSASMQMVGIQSSLSGHVVFLTSGKNILGLNVESDCTGVQGIIAFGMLSTMAVLDIKTKATKLIPLFAIGFLGAFLINIVRLFVVFLSFEYLGVAIGTQVHVYLGYLLFIVWVLVFWSLAFRYLLPKKSVQITSATLATT